MNFRLFILNILFFTVIFVFGSYSFANCQNEVAALVHQDSGLTAIVRELAQMAVSLSEVDEQSPTRVVLAKAFSDKSLELSHMADTLNLRPSQREWIKDLYGQEIINLQKKNGETSLELRSSEEKMRNEEKILLTTFNLRRDLGNPDPKQRGFVGFYFQLLSDGQFAKKNGSSFDRTEIEVFNMAEVSAKASLVLPDKTVHLKSLPKFSPNSDDVAMVTARKNETSPNEIISLGIWRMADSKDEGFVIVPQFNLDGIIKWSPSGESISVPSSDGKELIIYDKTLTIKKAVIKCLLGGRSTVKFSADGRYVVVFNSTSPQEYSGLWDLTEPNKNLLANFAGHASSVVEDAFFSNNGPDIFLKTKGGQVIQLDLNKKEFTKNISATPGLKVIEVSSLGEVIWGAHNWSDYRIEIIRHDDSKLVISGNPDETYSGVSVSPDGLWLAMVLRNSRNPGTVLAVRSTVTGLEVFREKVSELDQDLDSKKAFIPTWSPDGRYVSIKGNDWISYVIERRTP